MNIGRGLIDWLVFDCPNGNFAHADSMLMLYTVCLLHVDYLSLRQLHEDALLSRATESKLGRAAFILTTVPLV